MSLRDTGAPTAPTGVFLAIFVLTLGLAGALGGYAMSLYQSALQSWQTSERIKYLNGAIIHLDEVLTMSARMAAATGEARWEQRYRRFEPLLEADLEEAVGLMPPHGKASVAQTATANTRLVELETEAFAAVRRETGRPPECCSLAPRIWS